MEVDGLADGSAEALDGCGVSVGEPDGTGDGPGDWLGSRLGTCECTSEGCGLEVGTKVGIGDGAGLSLGGAVRPSCNPLMVSAATEDNNSRYKLNSNFMLSTMSYGWIQCALNKDAFSTCGILT